MNEHDAGRFLAVAVTLDSKMARPDEGGFIRRVWAEALADVPYREAHRALMAYYRSEAYAQRREPISPADIALWWSSRRRPTEAERTGTTSANRRALPAPPADPERVRAGVDAVRAALLTGTTPRPNAPTPEQAADAVARQRARKTRPCRHCGAREGEPCVDVRGNPLTKTDAHPSRDDEAPATRRGTADVARRELTTGDNS